ncbi:hypothetical protein RS130_03005 [Paraglaciecola aquimarina]|uniref:Beta-ketoacyl synthase N-terminal domain-containing protein n=1 Tax=Paraglaciecola aquimarina TaxID=1235557 RepID=A0ABU3SSS9_9ALTE|nr:hypothetical protein [Paraglaciecola aquimarina]MDU0353040.1 hypothetical protein [Paraglaciecola aquimarina]
MKVTVLKQASYCHDRTVENKTLRRQIKDEFGVAVRRIDNFTLSGLAAVAKLNADLQQSDKLALISCAQYFSVELLQQLILEVHAKQSIKPLNFVSTVGNAANFYIAKEFAMHGSNLFVGADQQAIEKTLLISALTLAEAENQQAVALIWNETQTHRHCHAMLLENAHADCIAKRFTAEQLLSGSIATPFILDINDLYST